MSFSGIICWFNVLFFTFFVFKFEILLLFKKSFDCWLIFIPLSVLSKGIEDIILFKGVELLLLIIFSFFEKGSLIWISLYLYWGIKFGILTFGIGSWLFLLLLLITLEFILLEKGTGDIWIELGWKFNESWIVLLDK